MISNATEFGPMVARARKALGITQRELVLAINAGERFIVDLEAGKPTALLGKALAAARAAGVRLEDVSGNRSGGAPGMNLRVFANGMKVGAFRSGETGVSFQYATGWRRHGALSRSRCPCRSARRSPDLRLPLPGS
ncbi:hypothetical protein [Hyphomonas sp.]|uniref:hypothetical protein n=1 Tax=Hyphomonas sp. TaxID=87 RepID=UPI0025BC036C|nr:hypothetical protein [Hyphomonas sp.]